MKNSKSTRKDLLRVVGGGLALALVAGAATAQTQRGIRPVRGGPSVGGSIVLDRGATVPADLVLYDGFLYTVDDRGSVASAVAIRRGRILAVGSDAEALAFAGPHTRLVDLAGRMAMPGIHDSHIHILEAFQRAAGTCYLPPGMPFSQYIPILQACAPNQLGTNWVLGFGHSIFDMQQFLESGGDPLAILDAGVPNAPAAMLEETSHSVWVNSKGLQALGIDRTTPDPIGGAILHDPITGEPNGVLLDAAGEMAMDLALSPNPVLDQLNFEALLEGLAFANQNGITSLCDARCYWKRGYVEAWKRVRDAGLLSVRAIVGLWAYPYVTDDAKQVADLIALHSDAPGSKLRFQQVKLYADGEISHTTAAQTLPYQVNPSFLSGPMAGPRGLNYFDEARLTYYVTHLEAAGFDCHIHAIGDRGVHEALNAIEAARANLGGMGSARHRLTHISLVRDEDLGRFASLGVIADFQPLRPGLFQFFYNIYLPTSLLQAERERVRSIYDTGARVVLSSDYDVGSISPFVGMQTALALGSESLPSIDAAIRAYTTEPAYLMRQEDLVGSIEVGKRADIIVLDRNITRVPVASIGRTRVLLTLLDGKEVWRDPSF